MSDYNNELEEKLKRWLEPTFEDVLPVQAAAVAFSMAGELKKKIGASKTKRIEEKLSLL